jgi:hypothetical protein
MNKEVSNFIFDYVDGVLHWKNPTNPRRTAIGSVAGSISKRGYIHVQYLNKIYKAHQIVFLMFNGFIPKTIDHINGILTDNRIENLRQVNTSENQQNSKIRKDNSSGVKNVSWHTRAKKWGVQLSVNGKIKHFGYFNDLELADLVAKEARNKYHREFARHE